MKEATKEKINHIIARIEAELRIAFNEYAVGSNLKLDESYIKDAIKTHLIIPAKDIMERGGKRLRPLLLILLNSIFGGNEEEAYHFSPVIEAIHTASLIHDDIEDSSPTRRSFPSAHIKYGLDVSLNAGAFLYFFSLSLIDKQRRDVQPLLYRACISALQKLHIGQAMDIKHHNNYSLYFDSAMYESLASLKTGTLFALVADVAYILSEGRSDKREEIELFNELGVAFQMLDDLKNISDGNKGKERGDDVVEGKLSFPIALYLEKMPENKELIFTLFKNAKEAGISSCYVEECCKLLLDSGVVEEGKIQAKKKIDLSFEKLYHLHGSNCDLDVIFEIFQSML